MEYRVVEDYYRQEHFDFYKSYGSPFYSTTITFDITRVKKLSDHRGESIYLLLGRPIADGPPGDPKATYQLRFLRTAEIAKALSDKNLKDVTVLILVNLGQLWANLGER